MQTVLRMLNKDVNVEKLIQNLCVHPCTLVLLRYLEILGFEFPYLIKNNSEGIGKMLNWRGHDSQKNDCGKTDQVPVEYFFYITKNQCQSINNQTIKNQKKFIQLI